MLHASNELREFLLLGVFHPLNRENSKHHSITILTFPLSSSPDAQVCSHLSRFPAAPYLEWMDTETHLRDYRQHMQTGRASYAKRKQSHTPRVAISHRVTPYAHTSDAVVNSLFIIDSMAIHFQGSRPWFSFT